MKHFNTFFILGTLMLFTAPVISSAAELDEGEIHYGTIQERSGADALIHYQSTDGEFLFNCNLKSLDCEEVDDDEDLLEDQLYIPSWWNDPNGHHSLHIIRYAEDVVAYRLHKLEDGKAEGSGTLIPLNKEIENVFFARDEKALVMLAEDGTMHHFDTETNALTSHTLPEKNWRLLSASPDISLIAGYSDYASKYTIVNTKTGRSTTVPSSRPSTIRFSEDGTYAAWLTEEDGEARLAVGRIGPDMSVSIIDSHINTGTTVFDFIFVRNELYTIANTNDPYAWQLFSYSPTSKQKNTISEHGSYNQELVVHKNYLFYSTINGNISDIERLDTLSGQKENFGLTPKPETIENLKYSNITLDDGRLHAVLIEPKKKANKSLPLIVWLHGGPHRQASNGYHSYFSYAVYDELLERLADDGARVLKLDYTGSWGHGEVFKNNITGNVGVVDMEDIEIAIKEVQDRYKTSDVYVLGNSYGGYLAMKAAVDIPELVDAIVSINGVSDWIDLIQQIPSSPFIRQFGGAPNALTLPAYARATVVTKLKDADRDPMLIVYGNEDSTVPNRQSQLFLVAAGSANKDAQELVLKGEGHVLKNRSSLNKLCREVASVFDIDATCR